jgi:type II secretory pathway predicted ATPase ExeA
MGKTTLLFHLLAKFDRTARTAFLFQTQCSSREFMRFLLAEIGIETDSQDFVRMHEQFNRCLVQEARAGKRFIVVIDEAQNLDATVLETVRLLSDFETPQAKLLQIVLVGQPGLADKLASPSLVQLRQRITSVSGLDPLSPEEVGHFIDHRLHVAGYRGNEPLFTGDALELIAHVSEGIPRQINNYCFHSLSLACAMRKKMVDVAMVREVTRDLDITRFVSDLGVTGNRHQGLNGGSDPYQSVEELEGAAKEYAKSTISTDGAAQPYLSPAEAIEHMRDVARLLHNWRSGRNSA